MLYNSFLKNGIVYVPTVVKLQAGAYVDVEPVAVVPVANTDALRRAFLDAISKGNAIVPNPPKDKWPPPVLLKYTGAKTWSAFARGALHWHILDKHGEYQIAGHLVHDGHWKEDPEQKTIFPTGTKAQDVIDRMIAILQEAARS